MNTNTQSKSADIIFLISFTSILMFFGILMLFPSNTDFSERENRPLASPPRFSLKAVASGDYFGDISSFYSDRFPLRDGFMSIYSLCELSLGKREVGGVFVGNGILASPPEYNNTENIASAVDKISRYAERRQNVHLYVPPSTAAAFSSMIPSGFARADASYLLQGKSAEAYLAYLDFAYEKSNYHTDHHWSTDGAYFAYTQICEMLGERAYEKDFFERVTASEAFYGTAFSACGLPYSLVQADTVTLYRYAGDSDICIINRETDSVQNGFYDMSFLLRSDKYRVFLGGNYSHLSIMHKTGDKQKLLLIKDSFANSLIPFLALHFDIEVIDPRFASPDEIRSVANQDFSQILFLLSFDTLNSIG